APRTATGRCGSGPRDRSVDGACATPVLPWLPHHGTTHGSRGTLMDKLLLVSADGHAIMPPELLPEYLEARYHELLPPLHEENEVFVRSMTLVNDAQLTYGAASPDEGYDVFDADHIYRSGRWSGAWDPDVRIEEMDREGVAAEFVFHGYFRAVDLFYNVSNA